MKFFRAALLFSGLLLMAIFVISCHKGNNEFGVADTFNVDTILVSPSTNIDQAFEVGWAVTVTGFPTYFVKLYLSNDATLDTLTDVKITDVGSADISDQLNVPEETQFYIVQRTAGSSQVTILHNDKTSDINASGWETSKSFPDPSGSTKYIIGYFYNITGLQIQYKRRLLAVPVTFK